MVEHLTEQKLLKILQEARQLAENNQTISSQDLVKQIKELLLQR